MNRFEDERLLRGTGRYVEDHDSAQCLHAVFVRSPHAHARIVSFDSRAARESERVRGVFSSRDFLAEGVRPLVCVRPIEGSDGAPFRAPTRHVLALEESRFVGDPVAMVVATSIDAAADAAERVEVEYEPLPVVLDPRESDEVAVVRRIGDPEATESAFSRAAHVVRVEHANNRMWAAPIETRSAIGRYDAVCDTYRLDTQSQGVHVMRTLVAASLGIDEDRLRVITPDVGGSFGMKLVNYPEQSAVLVAARVLGAPVRWVSTRAGGCPHRHPRAGSPQRRRACPRRGGRNPRAALHDPRRHGRVRVRDGDRLARHRVCLLPPQPLPHSRSRPDDVRGVHPYRPGRRVSRRGEAGGCVRDGAVDGCSGTADRNRSHGIARTQSRHSPRDALPCAERRGMGLRRLSRSDAGGASRGGLGHLRVSPSREPCRGTKARLRPRALPAHRRGRHRRNLRSGSECAGPHCCVRRSAGDRARPRDDISSSPVPASRRAAGGGRAGSGRYRAPPPPAARQPGDRHRCSARGLPCCAPPTVSWTSCAPMPPMPWRRRARTSASGPADSRCPAPMSGSDSWSSALRSPGTRIPPAIAARAPTSRAMAPPSPMEPTRARSKSIPIPASSSFNASSG